MPHSHLDYTGDRPPDRVPSARSCLFKGGLSGTPFYRNAALTCGSSKTIKHQMPKGILIMQHEVHGSRATMLAAIAKLKDLSCCIFSPPRIITTPQANPRS